MIHVKHLILASNSSARKAMLKGCGLEFTTCPASINERALEKQWQKDHLSPVELALRLAVAKAESVSQLHSDAAVIGSDQVLSLEGQRFSKAENKAEARQILTSLRGKSHSLHSAVVVAEGGKILFSLCLEARMTMRSFSDAFLETYLKREGKAILGSAGCYHYEGFGLTLFADVKGDMHTILGMPLLPLLNFLREREWIPQ